MTSTSDALPEALGGERRSFKDSRAGRISYYAAGPLNSGPDRESGPLLLLHSINASASAHEVRPLFDEFQTHRPTYAMDLPGYGHSERSDRTYSQRLMVDAIHAMVNQIRREHPDQPVDVLAVSISCEFLAKAALESPGSIRSLALVSPTGLARNAATRGPPEADCRRPCVLRVLNLDSIGQPLFRLLRSAGSVRFFLKKTWGKPEIDETMFEVSLKMARHPSAHHAPFHFLSGFLFGADMPTIYSKLELPIWLVHGTRGDFTDYRRADAIAKAPNWHTTVLTTGALPYFEVPEEFNSSYRRFLEQI